MTQVINFLASPSAGKSCVSAGLFYQMKIRGYSVELVTEFAKELVWEERNFALKDQLFVFAKQNRMIERLRGKVDWAIVDSPGILSPLYAPKNYYKTFLPLVLEVHNSYNNINYLLERTDNFEEKGRIHNLQQSLEIDERIKTLLNENNIPFTPIKNDSKTIATILFDISSQNK